MKFSHNLASLAVLGLTAASPVRRQDNGTEPTPTMSDSGMPAMMSGSMASMMPEPSMSMSTAAMPDPSMSMSMGAMPSGEGSAATGAGASMPSASSSMGGMGGMGGSSGSGPSETQILQYALTLEHLESTFYQQALEKYSAQDFKDAGFPDWVRGRVSQVSQHEQSHVKLLSAALGDNAVQACEYSFPYTDVRSFLVFACGLENIGVSAYIGANQYINSANYSTIAAAVTAVEARHQAFFYAPVLKQAAWTGPYDTPLGLDMVYTLASQVITSCPDSNAMLPVMAASPLTMDGSPIFNAEGGQTIQLTYDGMGDGQMAAIYNGLGSTMVSVSSDGSVTLPDDIQGYSYIIITTASDIASVSTNNTVAGPAEIQSSFDSMTSNPGFMNPYGA